MLLTAPSIYYKMFHGIFSPNYVNFTYYIVIVEPGFVIDGHGNPRSVCEKVVAATTQED